jgi:hypothetical protein
MVPWARKRASLWKAIATESNAKEVKFSEKDAEAEEEEEEVVVRDSMAEMIALQALEEEAVGGGGGMEAKEKLAAAAVGAETSGGGITGTEMQGSITTESDVTLQELEVTKEEVTVRNSVTAMITQAFALAEEEAAVGGRGATLGDMEVALRSIKKPSPIPSPSQHGHNDGSVGCAGAGEGWRGFFVLLSIRKVLSRYFIRVARHPSLNTTIWMQLTKLLTLTVCTRVIPFLYLMTISQSHQRKLHLQGTSKRQSHQMKSRLPKRKKTMVQIQSLLTRPAFQWIVLQTSCLAYFNVLFLTWLMMWMKFCPMICIIYSSSVRVKVKGRKKPEEKQKQEHFHSNYSVKLTTHEKRE